MRITAMRSDMVSASSWSCVTNTKVMPMSRWMRFSSSCIWRRSSASSAESGSSSSSAFGSFTSARASATRWRCPPESWWGFRFAKSPRRTISSISRTRRSSSLASAAADARPEGHVVEHGEVREERVALEDGVHRAPVRRHAHHVHAVEAEHAGRHLLEARDHAQHGGLAAARGAEHREELGGADLEARLVHGDEVAVALRDALDRDHGLRHARTSVDGGSGGASGSKPLSRLA